jgi:hypothetical protein
MIFLTIPFCKEKLKRAGPLEPAPFALSYSILLAVIGVEPINLGMIIL